MRNYWKALFVIVVPTFIGKFLDADLIYFIAWYSIGALWLVLDKLDEIKNNN